MPVFSNTYFRSPFLLPRWDASAACRKKKNSNASIPKDMGIRWMNLREVFFGVDYDISQFGHQKEK